MISKKIMKIDKVRAHQINLPFYFDFSHALRKRSSVKNIIVEIVAEQGEIIGYGEGAPRSFVTGESPESAVRSIHRFTKQDNFPWELNNVFQIWDFVDDITSGKSHNAAICALETAMLDALGKTQGKNIIDYFSKDFLTSNIYYGAALPLTNKQKIMEICRLIKKMNVNKLKLKMGKGFIHNKEILEAVRLVFGEDCDLKVDINGVWDYALAFRHVPLLKNYKVKVVEQPMIPNDPDIADFASLMQTEGVILMADESACSISDVKKIAKEGYYEMINVRLSKCGGFRNSFKQIDYLRSNGFFFQIGCHLGESGILSAAGRVLCLLCRDAIYYDGSYDEFLLKENVTLEDVTFGPGGKAGPLDGSGLGIAVSDQSLARLSESSTTLTISRPKGG